MTDRSINHATFVVERTYDATPKRVFRAWADPAAKNRWFMNPGPQWEAGDYVLDFRAGGEERMEGRWEGTTAIAYRARYQDIVDDERIVYTYEMYIDGNRISVSLGSIVLHPVDSGAKTRLVYTEQGAFLDGHDNPADREAGTEQLLDLLATELDGEPAGD